MKRTHKIARNKQIGSRSFSKNGAGQRQGHFQRSDNQLAIPMGLGSMRSPDDIRLTRDNILFLQRAIGNQMVAKSIQGRSLKKSDLKSTVQAQGKGQILLSYEQMDGVFNSWVRTYAGSRNLPENNIGVLTDALTKVASQVGPVNFQRYLDGGGGVYIGPITYVEDAPTPEKGSPTGKGDLMGGLYQRMRERATSLNNAATRLSNSMAQAEYFTHKLKSPEGAKGVAYQITAGVLGIYAAGKHAKDYAAKQVDPIGQAVDKGVDAAVGKEDKPDPTFTEKADELGQTAGTSVELMTGQLHKLYQTTRPSYTAFQTAQVSFGNARSAFWRSKDLDPLSEQLGNMMTHLKAMRAASLQYLMTCDIHGIRRKAGALVALDKAIVDALKATVSSSVGKLGGLSPVSKLAGDANEKAGKKVADSLGDKVSDKARENIKIGVEKAVGKATGVPGGIPQKAAEKAVE